MLPVLSDADHHAFHPLHLVTMLGKCSLSINLPLNEVINKTGVGQVVQNGATVAGVNATHQSWEPKWKINDFVCLDDYDDLVWECVL